MRPSFAGSCRSLFFPPLLVLCALLAPAAAPMALAQTCDGVAPYAFVLLDTSGSMNVTPPCSQAQWTAGACSPLCPTGNCYAPLTADDPSSKFYQAKQALHGVVSGLGNVLLGFGAFNQDALNVRGKHWFYQAAGAGVVIPGWGAFPALGATEVFGLPWACNEGAGDAQIGCSPTQPADLPDAWELARVQHQPKGAFSYSQSTTFYLRTSNLSVYRVIYQPLVSGGPGLPGNATVTIAKCVGTGCNSTTAVGSRVVPYTPVAEFLDWEWAFPLSRTDPWLDYSGYVVNDAFGSNSCSGWEPNTDSTADLSSGYDLKWATAPDSRGATFASGDVLPLDWTTDHKADILGRLAPNLVSNPTAVPDFRTSVYLKDLPLTGETFLRLKDETARPLIAVGSGPVGASIRSFRTWYASFAVAAAAQDPSWSCRRTSLVLLVDDDDVCGNDPCTEARTLYDTYGVKVYVLGFGLNGSSDVQLHCVAGNGGTGDAYYPQTGQDLSDDLNTVFTLLQTP